jgi:hypothetical protein
MVKTLVIQNKERILKAARSDKLPIKTNPSEITAAFSTETSHGMVYEWYIKENNC